MQELVKPTVQMIRTGLGLTQSEMAEKLGIGRNTYRKSEMGIREFTYGEITMILKIAGLQYDQVRFKP